MADHTIGRQPATASSNAAVSRAIARINFYVFASRAFSVLYPGEQLVHANYIELICHELQEVAEGRVLRLNINVPPRHLKSFLVSIALPAWLMGRDPTFKVLFASYGQELADAHARPFRTLVQTPFYQTLFPQFHLVRNTSTVIETTEGGFRRATGLGGSLTGFGADLIILDDLAKASDVNSPALLQQTHDFYQNTIASRLNDRNTGRLISIQQRIAENDLAGLLLSNTDFRHVVLPATAVERETFTLYNGRTWTREPGDLLNPARQSHETLESLRREMGDALYSTQYQQNPIPPGGNRIRWSWFGRYAEAPARDQCQYIVQSWDTAVTGLPTSDWSVCLTFGKLGDHWLLLDVHRARYDYPDLKAAAIAVARHWQADTVIIERAGTGISLAGELRRHQISNNCSIISPSVRLAKDVRLEAQTASLQAGLVQLPIEAPWLVELRHELLGFPNARHDDQVDALTQFLECATGRRIDGILEESRMGRRQSIERQTGHRR